IAGWVACVPWGTDSAVVNHRSAVVRPESPLELLTIFVDEPEPRRPRSVIPTCVGAAPVLVTTFSQRTQGALLGRYTMRVTWRPCAGSVWAWKLSCRLVPFCGQSCEAGAAPGLKGMGGASFTPLAPEMMSPLKPAKAFVSGTSTVNCVVKTVAKPKT